jgi:hypothetical protein
LDACRCDEWTWFGVGKGTVASLGPAEDPGDQRDVGGEAAALREHALYFNGADGASDQLETVEEELEERKGEVDAELANVVVRAALMDEDDNFGRGC